MGLRAAQRYYPEVYEASGKPDPGQMELENAVCEAGEGGERQWDSSDMGIPPAQDLTGNQGIMLYGTW